MLEPIQDFQPWLHIVTAETFKRGYLALSKNKSEWLRVELYILYYSEGFPSGAKFENSILHVSLHEIWRLRPKDIKLLVKSTLTEIGLEP